MYFKWSFVIKWTHQHRGNEAGMLFIGINNVGQCNTPLPKFDIVQLLHCTRTSAKIYRQGKRNFPRWWLVNIAPWQVEPPADIGWNTKEFLVWSFLQAQLWYFLSCLRFSKSGSTGKIGVDGCFRRHLGGCLICSSLGMQLTDFWVSECLAQWLCT